MWPRDQEIFNKEWKKRKKELKDEDINNKNSEEEDADDELEIMDEANFKYQMVLEELKRQKIEKSL